MDLTFVIALSGLAGTLLNSLIITKAAKIKTTAETSKLKSEDTNIQIATASKLISDLRIELERQSIQIENLKEEVSKLKSREKEHEDEKIRLEEKLYELRKENDILKGLIESNKKTYNDKINKLTEKISALQNELKSYQASHEKSN